jgi:hypothetical protein
MRRIRRLPTAGEVTNWLHGGVVARIVGWLGVDYVDS